tara:strand:+ start:1222 stop:1530 length:309 start_codon:yes stop_codon:yes gene_type:complete
MSISNSDIDDAFAALMTDDELLLTPDVTDDELLMTDDELLMTDDDSYLEIKNTLKEKGKSNEKLKIKNNEKSNEKLKIKNKTVVKSNYTLDKYMSSELKPLE